MIVYSMPPGYRRTAPVKRPELDGFTEINDRCLVARILPDETRKRAALFSGLLSHYGWKRRCKSLPW